MNETYKRRARNATTALLSTVSHGSIQDKASVVDFRRQRRHPLCCLRAVARLGDFVGACTRQTARSKQLMGRNFRGNGTGSQRSFQSSYGRGIEAVCAYCGAHATKVARESENGADVCGRLI